MKLVKPYVDTSAQIPLHGALLLLSTQNIHTFRLDIQQYQQDPGEQHQTSAAARQTLDQLLPAA